MGRELSDSSLRKSGLVGNSLYPGLLLTSAINRVLQTIRIRGGEMLYLVVVDQVCLRFSSPQKSAVTAGSYVSAALMEEILGYM